MGKLECNKGLLSWVGILEVCITCVVGDCGFEPHTSHFLKGWAHLLCGPTPEVVLYPFGPDFEAPIPLALYRLPYLLLLLFFFLKNGYKHPKTINWIYTITS